MEHSSDDKKKIKTSTEATAGTKDYSFGGIKEYSLEKIEDEILNESLYLDVFAGSDIAFKENVQNLDLVLPLLMNLDCIKFDYNTNEFKDKNFSSERQVGVIANQVAEHFPELVKRDSEGYLYVNYSQLSTIAIQAVKELSFNLNVTNKKLIELEEKIKKITEN